MTRHILTLCGGFYYARWDVMDVDYVCFKCKNKECGNNFVCLNEDVENHDKRISCPFCRSRATIEDSADTVRDCMKERSYNKRRGIVRQTRYDT